MLNSSKYKVIYRTFSICPICRFVERKPEEFVHSCVIVKHKKLWYVYKCKEHGQFELLYFSSMKFFTRLLSFTPGLMEEKYRKGVGDLEEMQARMGYKSPIQNRPLIVSFDLLKEESGKKLGDRLISTTKKVYGDSQKNFFIKLNAKMDDLGKVNLKVRSLLSLEVVQKNSILLELPFTKFERMIQLEKTVLLTTNVYPYVKIYIEKGNEDVNVRELRQVFHSLGRIKNLNCVISICISRPLPDMKKVLQVCREEHSICKYIIIDVERSPAQMRANLKSNTVHFDEKNINFNLDLYQVVKMVEKLTEREILEEDFLPVSTAMVAEQFLQLVGFGDYNIRPSPLCGVGTILINTEENKSVPITRFLQMDKLFKQMIPVLKHSTFDSLTFNFFKAKKFQKILKNCVKKNSSLKKVKNIGDYLTGEDEKKMEYVKTIFDDAQVLVIHNNMDLGCVDLGRRSRCSQCYVRKDSLLSDCTKCV